MSVNNYGNGNIKEKQISPMKILMFRYESEFEYYVEEPKYISVVKKPEENSQNMELILRITLWNYQKEGVAWSIYADEREEYSKIVLRKIVWDVSESENRIKTMRDMRENYKEYRRKLLLSSPDIATYNYYTEGIPVQRLKEELEPFDNILQNGIILSPQKNIAANWSNIDVLRKYEWGQLHYTWSPEVQCKELEDIILSLIKKLDTIMEEINQRVESICLHYNLTPDTYKELYGMDE